MAPAARAARKRVLLLHGFVQSGKIFSSKTGGLRKSLNRLGFELYYPTGPIGVTKEEVMAMHNFKGNAHKDLNLPSELNTADEYAGWWKRKSLESTDFNIDQSVMNYLHDYVIEHGPFDGIIGFSQGAAFAGYLLTDFNRLLNLTEKQQPPFKFFVAFSGFKLEPLQFQASYDERPINVPSLHVQGEQDTVVVESRMLKLYDSCEEDKRMLLKHSGGHFVPNARQFASVVCNWIQMTEEGSAKTQPETEKKEGTTQPELGPDLGDDLLGTIDSMVGSVKIKD